MITPLWAKGNDTMYSSVFTVMPGTMVTLLAVGLEQFAYRQDSRTARDQQRVCVARVVHEQDFTPTTVKRGPQNTCGCFVYAMPPDVKVIEETIRIGDCPFQLSTCNNFLVLTIPGAYRLHFNDETMIGKTQVYAEIFGLSRLPGVNTHMPVHANLGDYGSSVWL